MKKPTFLLVDDNDNFRMRLLIGLEERGFNVLEAGTIDEGMELMRNHEVGYAIIDLRMPGGTGLDFLSEMKDEGFETKVVLLTGYASIATATKAIRMGAINYLSKPADIDQILRAFNEEFLNALPDENEIETPSLDQIEWEHIQRVLDDCNGNITQAAKRMGMHRRTLQRKLKKHAPVKQDI